jgi:hypothetical protein
VLIDWRQPSDTDSVTDLQMLLLVGALAIAYGTFAWRRRARTARLLAELSQALGLAADAQSVHWRLERRYSTELGNLARLRRELAPFVDGTRHGRRTRWELGASDDGSTFDLAILAGPVLGSALGRGRRLGYKHLLTAHGDHGTIAYDTLAADERYLPRLQPARARRRGAQPLAPR